jgi:hypothetical protein
MVYIEVVMIYYKIRLRSNNEMYVKGTPVYMSHDKTGRIFQSLGQLRSFLTSVMSNYHRLKAADISDWEIVELEMVVKEVKGVHEVITAKKLMELLKK